MLQLKMTLVSKLHTHGVVTESDQHALLKPLQRVLEVLHHVPRDYHFEKLLRPNVGRGMSFFRKRSDGTKRMRPRTPENQVRPSAQNQHLDC